MAQAHDFPPTSVGPFQSQSQFDGVQIQTDILTNPAQDSVIPILLEEQVFTCRQMAVSLRWQQSLLNRGLNVLDVGTGSGVLAIYAERVLNQHAPTTLSTVVGIDLSPRAIALAQQNSQINYCYPDQIHFLYQPQGYTCDSVSPNSQDIVVINPPFNPTYPDLQGNLAYFGDSDDSGLQVFQTWIRPIALHLRPSGLLIGCQLTPVVDGTVLALAELNQVFGPTARIRFCHILEGPYSMEAFLLGEYRDCLQTLPSAQAKRFREWIASMSEHYPEIAFIYYEASKTGGTQDILETIQPVWTDFDRSWESRITIHRDFVNAFYGHQFAPDDSRDRAG